MGDIGRVVPPLPVGDEVQYRPRVKYTGGQDVTQQHLYLGDGQAGSFFFNLRHARTRKKWAKIQSVI